MFFFFLHNYLYTLNIKINKKKKGKRTKYTQNEKKDYLNKYSEYIF